MYDQLIPYAYLHAAIRVYFILLLLQYPFRRIAISHSRPRETLWSGRSICQQ